LSINAIVKAQEGHQGVPLGMAEIATALYTRHLKFNPQDAGWFDRDRVVLSNGHGSMLLYARWSPPGQTCARSRCWWRRPAKGCRAEPMKKATRRWL
jgi:transketolase